MLDQLLATAVQWGSLPRLARIRQQPHEVQARLLRQLLARAQATEWGQRYGFRERMAADDFAQRVPVSTYEQLYPELEKVLRGQPNVLWPGRPRWFAKSSGTTNARSKYIPVTAEALHACHYRAGRDMLALSTHFYPQERLLAGKTLSLGGAHLPNPFRPQEPASRIGDVSALIMQQLPWWAEQMRTPPLALALLDEWEEKIERIAAHVLTQDVRTLAGVPTWMVVLLRRVVALAGAADITQVWPNLRLFLHGAVAFGPYRELFRQLIPDVRMRYLEIYSASEGYFALQDQPDSEDLLLLLDHGIYYEFLPADQWAAPDPRPVPLAEVELHRPYALVISTNAGLWRYLVGDTVRFTSLAPYRVRITGRTKHFLNAFGEEVVIENAEAAVAAASRATGAAVRDFTAAPVWFAVDSASSRGGHEWAIEFASDACLPDLAKFGAVLDATLCELNSDYAAKRHRSLALAPPRLRAVPAGTFEAWLASQGKLGGQHKVPRLLNSRAVLEAVLQSAAEATTRQA
ncbi:GH3 auxin-responsive promoter family protein [Hymenobacter sp. BT770]|uniref:GH3 auxin-responsive promoter family protein n=1 Tax=Hymenobacter sp. BT770 TaxID=2886942 RepID=UPI001D11E8C0|nr:GH3 auxin-responsive promoter family protein [Hymenobacter sp. BT770]MCC3153384.1 GH3 auxin-responsive promoter family protein [Hymenobacter sp. BT770]MDO3415534.1 GH3 auxin-responsive promoter family protein [Hymenobacter sp. BT770]